MCRNKATQRRIIDAAKRETPNVHALFEHTDYGDDLVGLVKEFDALTVYFEVVGTELKKYDTAKPGTTVDKRTTMRNLGLTDRMLGRFYKLVAC